MEKKGLELISILLKKEEVAKSKRNLCIFNWLFKCLQNGIAVEPENAELNPAQFNYEYAETFRLISIAQTTIEEASMWAVKSIS